MLNFQSFNLSDEVLRGISYLGYLEPTEIQRAAIPLLLSGKDLIAQAQTGTGKTSAFGIPIVEGTSSKLKVAQALIIVPTRELALQVSEEIKNLGKYKKIFALSIYGGKPLQKQVDFLKKGLCHIIVGTPGRLKDLLNRGVLQLEKVKYLVLDEADRMLEMGFLEDIEEIIKACPKERQTMLFSATLPREILSLAEKFLKLHYAKIRIRPEELTLKNITQKVYKTSKRGKLEKLIQLLMTAEGSKTIIFTPTKVEAETLASTLRERGFQVEALHGDYSQKKREAILKAFRNNFFYILVATDVASRGLDIKDVELVINYGLPKDSNSYVHRIGRTGRAGRKGIAISLVAPEEEKQLNNILYKTKGNLELCRD